MALMYIIGAGAGAVVLVWKQKGMTAKCIAAAFAATFEMSPVPNAGDFDFLVFDITSVGEEAMPLAMNQVTTQIGE